MNSTSRWKRVPVVGEADPHYTVLWERVKLLMRGLQRDILSKLKTINGIPLDTFGLSF